MINTHSNPSPPLQASSFDEFTFEIVSDEKPEKKEEGEGEGMEQKMAEQMEDTVSEGRIIDL